jgi:hypothetical protein
MPDLDEIKQGEQGARDRRGRFAEGQSGNPAGRPRGSSNRATRAGELLLDGEATALTREAVGLVLAGDQAALRLCLDRTIAPRRERTVELALPPIRSADDILAAIKWPAARLGAAPSLRARGSHRPR